MSKTSSDQSNSLAEQIEADIYSGKFSPGAWLKQIDLEARYGCTRLALRDALERLRSRKIVDRVKNRGYYVPTIDLQTLKYVFRARALVESSIAEDLVQNIDSERLAKLSYLASVYSESVKTGTMGDQDNANQVFHSELLEACQNPVMVQLIWDLRGRIPLAVQRANNTPTQWEQSAHDHFEMIEALRTKDVPRLKAVTIRHVDITVPGTT